MGVSLYQSNQYYFQLLTATSSEYFLSVCHVILTTLLSTHKLNQSIFLAVYRVVLVPFQLLTATLQGIFLLHFTSAPLSPMDKQNQGIFPTSMPCHISTNDNQNQDTFPLVQYVISTSFLPAVSCTQFIFSSSMAFTLAPFSATDSYVIFSSNQFKN